MALDLAVVNQYTRWCAELSRSGNIKASGDTRDEELLVSLVLQRNGLRGAALQMTPAMRRAKSTKTCRAPTKRQRARGRAATRKARVEDVDRGSSRRAAAIRGAKLCSSPETYSPLAYRQECPPRSMSVDDSFACALNSLADAWRRRCRRMWAYVANFEALLPASKQYDAHLSADRGRRSADNEIAFSQGSGE